EDQRRTIDLSGKLMLPFFDVAQSVYRGFQNLLDARVPKERQRAALVRLKRYVGAERGYEPITKLARARYEEAATDLSLLGPWIVEAEQYLDNQGRYLDGIEKLLRDSGLEGWQKDLRTLRAQFDEYAQWARKTVLPRARETSRLPRELYADNLKNFGVEMAPEELIERAQSSYIQTRGELESLARQLAAQRKWSSSDYRDVIGSRRKERIADADLLAVYRKRLQEIEAIIRRERMMSQPATGAGRRRATAAETAAIARLPTDAEPAPSAPPHIDPPRLTGNTGEPAEFVLPTSNPNAEPGTVMDDFTYDAVAWTLTAHEARPGHELQFARMLERGV